MSRVSNLIRILASKQFFFQKGATHLSISTEQDESNYISPCRGDPVLVKSIVEARIKYLLENCLSFPDQAVAPLAACKNSASVFRLCGMRCMINGRGDLLAKDLACLKINLRKRFALEGSYDQSAGSCGYHWRCRRFRLR